MDIKLPEYVRHERDEQFQEMLTHNSDTNQWLFTDNFSDETPVWHTVLVVILGNRSGKVKPWWLPFDWIFARCPDVDLKIKTIIIKNKNIVPNIPGMAVIVLDKKVLRSVPRPSQWEIIHLFED